MTKQDNKIIIYGTHHELQWKKAPYPGDQLRDRERALYSERFHSAGELAHLVGLNPGIGLIAEEISSPSFAADLAQLESIEYVNIDKPALLSCDAAGMADTDDPDNRRIIRELEQFMFEQTLGRWNRACDILIVCDLFHVEGLRDHFESHGVVSTHSFLDKCWVTEELKRIFGI